MAAATPPPKRPAPFGTPAPPLPDSEKFAPMLEPKLVVPPATWPPPLTDGSGMLLEFAKFVSF
jgi:hypothetical protein